MARWTATTVFSPTSDRSWSPCARRGRRRHRPTTLPRITSARRPAAGSPPPAQTLAVFCLPCSPDLNPDRTVFTPNSKPSCAPRAVGRSRPLWPLLGECVHSLRADRVPQLLPPLRATRELYDHEKRLMCRDHGGSSLRYRVANATPFAAVAMSAATAFGWDT